MMNLAPICLFTFNRLEETEKTIEALKNNYLAKYSNLIVFSDGWNSDRNKVRVKRVRLFLKSIEGFNNVKIIESDKNKGLANSIIQGVSLVLKEYSSIIVLEDDLITSPNFLNFMNKSLNHYYSNEKIFSISGYTMDLPSLKNESNDVYFGFRASSWGWATWERSWIDIDWEIIDYKEFINNKRLKRDFNRGGSDMVKMLKSQMNGIIDSWAIRWCYNQFKRNQLTVFPTVSKVKSIGFGEDATHTKKTKRFDTYLDFTNKTEFCFISVDDINTKLLQEFKSKFSTISRLIDKII